MANPRPARTTVNAARRMSAALLVGAVLLAGCGRGGEEEPTEPLPEDETATVSEEDVAQRSAAAAWNCGAVKQHLYALVNTLTAAEAAAEGVVAAVVAENTYVEAWADISRSAPTEPATAETGPAGDTFETFDTDAALSAINAIALDAIDTAESAVSVLGDDDDGDDETDSEEDLRAAVSAAMSGFAADDEAALNAACELYGQHEAALELWEAGNAGDACDVWTPAKTSADRTAASLDISAVHPLVSKFWVGATGGIAEGNGRCIAERAN